MERNREAPAVQLGEQCSRRPKEEEAGMRRQTAGGSKYDGGQGSKEWQIGNVAQSGNGAV